MKLRSSAELEDALNHESGWRKKELIDLKLHVRQTREPAQRVLRRGGFALAYAHWEGFAKRAFEFYLTYVRTKGSPAQSLNASFAALALQTVMNQTHDAPSTARLPIALNEFREGRATSLPGNDFVSAAGNLHSEQLKIMLIAFGLDTTQYELRFNWLDGTLVKGRNDIAHGRETAPSLDEFLDTADRVIDLINELHTQISNAAASRDYMLVP